MLNRLDYLFMVKEFLFSAAVPKTMQMQLSTPLTSVIQPMDSLVQTMAISNPKKVLFFNFTGFHFYTFASSTITS